jgi:hypothetical protein
MLVPPKPPANPPPLLDCIRIASINKIPIMTSIMIANVYIDVVPQAKKIPTNCGGLQVLL